MALGLATKKKLMHGSFGNDESTGKWPISSRECETWKTGGMAFRITETKLVAPRSSVCRNRN